MGQSQGHYGAVAGSELVRKRLPGRSGSAKAPATQVRGGTVQAGFCRTIRNG